MPICSTFSNSHFLKQFLPVENNTTGSQAIIAVYYMGGY